MGVMTCSRTNCGNIMCDTHISGIGYVCYECQTEFKKHLDSNDVEAKTESQIHKELQKFMVTDKDADHHGEISVDDFFRRNTR